MGHVFISYHGEDGDFVADLIRQLEGAGFRAWSENERLRNGEGWREAIDQAIRDAFALIVVFSPPARASEQIQYEWMFALGVGVTVIPVIRKSTDLPARLNGLPRLEFVDEAVRPWGRLIRLVQDAQDGDNRPPLRPARPGSRPTFGRRPAGAAPFGQRNYDASDNWLDDIKPDDPAEVEKLIAALEDENADKRASAAARLGKLSDRTAIPALIKRLRDDDWRTREEAARALGKMKASAAVVGLLEAIQFARPGPFGGGGNVNVFIDAIKEIGTLAVPVLVDALSDEDPRMRLTIVDLLGGMRESDAVDALAGALRDPEWRVRWRAADALGRMGDEAAVPDLLDMLSDSTKDVRVSAAWALGKIGHVSAVEGLVKLLRDREWRVRWGAAEALWEIGEAAVPALIEMLRDPDEYVRRAAQRALAQIGAPAIPPLIKTLGDANWDVRWSAAGALQEIGDAAVEGLVAALDTAPWQATWAAAETLKRIGTKEAMKAVEKWSERRATGEIAALPQEQPEPSGEDEE